MATLTITPQSPAPSAMVSVVGASFDKGLSFTLQWETGGAGVQVKATATGGFTASIKAPPTIGTHTLSARRTHATATVTVTAPGPVEPPTTSGLHIIGNKIVNAAGQPIQLHGVNRASWEYASVGENGSDGYAFCDPQAPEQAEVDAMLDWHVNVVRISLNQSSWLNHPAAKLTPKYVGANYQAAVHQYVELLAKNGIASILNLHWNAAGDGVALDQQIMPDRDHSPTFWGSVASSFKNHPWVLFEPYNEPHPDGGHNDGDSNIAWECWRNGGKPAGMSPMPSWTPAGMTEIGAAIRATGATNIIIYTGPRYGSTLAQFLTHVPADATGQVAAGWHNYNDGMGCQDQACWDAELVPIMAKYPLIATELGEFTCKSVETVKRMKWLDAHGGHYTPWSWIPGNCAEEPALLAHVADKSNPASWLGQPSAYGQGVRDHMRTRN